MGGGLQGSLHSYTLIMKGQECPYSLSSQLHVFYFSNDKIFFTTLVLLSVDPLTISEALAVPLLECRFMICVFECKLQTPSM